MMADVQPQSTIALPLRLVEELVVRRLLRELGMRAVVMTDVFGLVAHQGRFDVHEPRFVSVLVPDLRKGRVRARYP